MTFIVDIDDIPEGMDWEWATTESSGKLDIDPREGVLTRDVHLKGQFRRMGRELFFTGEAETAIRLSCSRCLEPFEYPVQVKVSGNYLPDPEGQEESSEVELTASDIDIEFYSGNEIDLAQSVYDQIMLNLPIVRLCRNDCRGICSRCGANLNQSVCDCSANEDIDPRLAVLKSLKDKLK